MPEVADNRVAMSGFNRSYEGARKHDLPCLDSFRAMLGDFYVQLANSDGRAAGPPTHTSWPGYVWLSKGDGTFNRITVPAADTIPGNYQVYASGDFNGDGLADFYVQMSKGDRRADDGYLGYVWLSKGDGTFNRVTVPAADTMPDSYQVYASGDFNGDGLTDFYVQLANSDGRAAGPPTHTSWPGYVWLSKGDGTFNRITVPAADTIPGNYQVYASGDFNGDGLADFYVQLSNSDGRAAGPPTHTSWLGYVWTPTWPPNDQIAGIVNGLGNRIAVTHKPLTNAATYTKDSTATYPLVDLQGALYVVSRVDANNGIGGTVSTGYAYAGAKVDLSGRGFLGFRQMTVKDLQTNLVQTTDYRQDFPYIALVASETKKLGTVTLNATAHTYGATPLGGTRHQVFLTYSVASSADLNGSAPPIP